MSSGTGSVSRRVDQAEAAGIHLRASLYLRSSCAKHYSPSLSTVPPGAKPGGAPRVTVMAVPITSGSSGEDQLHEHDPQGRF
jgi:hypothetical protein